MDIIGSCDGAAVLVAAECSQEVQMLPIEVGLGRNLAPGRGTLRRLSAVPSRIMAVMAEQHATTIPHAWWASSDP